MTTQNTAAAEAPSASVIAEALELRRLVRSVLSESRPVSIEAAPAAGSPHQNDRTDNRIRAFMASMKPLRGCCFGDDIEAANARGRSLVERLALSAEGTDLPKLRLSAEQVADVLSFVHCSEPVEPEKWWQEPDDEPSHVVGLNLLLEALEKSLRERCDPAVHAAKPAVTNADNRSLESALSLLKVAVSSIDDAGGVTAFAEFSDLGEVVRLSGERISHWLSTIGDDTELAPAFETLDACTVIGALLDAGMDPRNSTTISPIRGVLQLAVDRLEEFLGAEAS